MSWYSCDRNDLRHSRWSLKHAPCVVHEQADIPSQLTEFVSMAGKCNSQRNKRLLKAKNKNSFLVQILALLCRK